MSRIARCLPVKRSRGRGDDGFTLVEVILAMVIVMIVMLGVLHGIVSSLELMREARERQAGTALATQVLERIRALPVATVTQPDGTTSYTAPAIEESGTGFLFDPSAVVESAAKERLVVNTMQEPLRQTWPGSGQRHTETVNGVTYSVDSYVSYSTSVTGAPAVYNLTAVVTWTSAVFPDGMRIAQRSSLFTGGDCLSDGTSPFAAPCQGFYTAQAGTSAASFSVTEPFTVDPAATEEPLATTLLSATFADLRTAMTLEQTAAGSAEITGSGVNDAGGSRVTAVVDADPSTDALLESAPPALNSAGGTVTSSGGWGTFIARHRGSSGSGRAAVMAEPGGCVTPTGSSIQTGPPGARRPCATAAVSMSTTPEDLLLYTAPAGSAISLLQGGGMNAKSVSAVTATANPGVACTSGSLTDCAHAAAQHSVASLILGAGGSADAATGYDPDTGVLAVENFSESSFTEAGLGARSPSYSRTGSVRVLTSVGDTGTPGYRTVDLSGFSDPAAVPQSVPIASVVTYASTTVVFDGDVTIRPPGVSQSGSLPCRTDGCLSATSSMPSVSAVVDVTVQQGASSVRFTVAVDLGGIVTRSSYKAGTDG